MGKKLVATTSTSCLDYYEHNYNIATIRIKLDIDGNLYSDGTDMKADYFYNYIKINKDLVPRTTQPPIGELLEFFEDLVEQGYSDVYVTTISSKLSGVFNGICQCSSILSDKINIRVFDTKTVCMNEGYFALKAAEMLDEGASFDEIDKALLKLQANNKIFFAVDSLEYLVKNGRLSGAAGLIGKYLKIKPLLVLCDNGTIEAAEKIRTTKKALEAVCNMVNDYTRNHNVETMFVHYTGVELKEFFLNILNEKCNIKEIKCCPCTPIVGCHVGPNAIGIGIFLKD